MRAGGAPIVLTADRTLMSRHRLLLDGMFVSSQTTSAPRGIVERLFLPRARHVDGQATVAPLGLRRLQAALVRDGFAPDEVVIADDAHLPAVCGPDTRLIGLSSGEPAGFGMSSSTMAGVIGGTIYPQMLFDEVRRAALATMAQRAPQAQLVLGGAGAWQIAHDDDLREKLGLPHVVTGYGEDEIVGLARQALAGEELPPLTTAACPSADRIPPVLGETTMGAIELSRGCGLGCDFCTLGTLPMLHLPEATILADAQTNLRAGQPNLSLLSEDLLRYDAAGVNCRPEAMLGLLRQLRELPGLRLLQADHTNIASVAQYDAAQLQELHHLLGGGEQRHPWLNLGIETASGELLVRMGGRAKMKGATPDTWGEFCREQLDRLMHAGLVPMVSLVLGSPTETEADTQQTLEWVRAFRGRRLMIFPVIHAPLEAPAHNQPRLTKLQWQVMREAYEFNFRYVPVVYGDSMRAGGVGPGRRAAIQLLGQGNVVLWRHMLRRRQGEAG
ncbi:MAG: hypothetical protein KKI08_16390 [Armatimonadetes bacterium]|nr:hypothetical protein [Armatimonadota bacterium]